MECALFLADHAEVVGDKLFVNGGAWTSVGPQVGPMALVLLFDINWNEANIQHAISISLVDEDGNAVTVQPANQPLLVSMGFEVGRPPGSTMGMPLTASMALNVGPLPLLPGKRYSWVVKLTSTTPPREWRRHFAVRPLPAAPTMPAV